MPTLNDLGRFVGRLLLVYFALRAATIMFQFGVLGTIEADEALARLVLFLIPTEVTIVETLAAWPVAMLIVLFLYWKYVR